MRLSFAAVFSGLALFSGCGYIGPVVPPSPQIPNPITDLNVIQRADRLLVTFTPPLHTTDDLTIRKFSEIELQISAGSQPVEYQIPLPTPVDRHDEPKLIPITFQAAAADWTGKRITVVVRTAVKQDKDYSDWSNPVKLTVLAPLSPPNVSIEATAQGYKLTWPDQGKSVRYEVLRTGPGDPHPVSLGTANAPEYVDSGTQWSTPYTYQVLARTDAAESMPSTPVSANHPDTFAPAIPVGLTGLATPDAVELSWQRNTESDLKGYYVYRSSDGGAFNRVGDLLSLPTFADRAVEHGKSYGYRVGAIDQTGNLSEQSAPVTIAFP